MINFPNSPTNGQTFVAGGITYTYTSGVWLKNPQNTGTAQARSRIVNGAMQISQENGNTAVASGGYAADQWFTAAGAGTVSLQRVQVPTPNGSPNRLRLTVTTGATLVAGTFFGMNQNIEGIRIADFRWGSASARQVVLRFGFKGPAGTYAIAFRAARSYIANFTIAAGQSNVDTEQTFVIPGDTTGTWPTDTSKAFELWITLASGSTFQGTVGWNAANVFGTSAVSNGLTTGNVFELWDAGLYLDPNTTGIAPAWQMPDEAQELAACQRYWWCSNLDAPKGGNTVGMISGHSPATSYISFAGAIRFAVPMRVKPTVTIWSNGSANWVRNVMSGASSSVSITANTYFSTVGTSFITTSAITAGTWWDFDLQANARM